MTGSSLLGLAIIAILALILHVNPILLLANEALDFIAQREGSPLPESVVGTRAVINSIAWQADPSTLESLTRKSLKKFLCIPKPTIALPPPPLK